MGVYRNPWDRVASAWAFHRRQGNTWAPSSFVTFVKGKMKNHHNNKMTRPQTHWLTHCHTVLMFDHLVEDFAAWCEIIGIAPAPLPHLLDSGAKWDDIQTPETRAIIADYYAEEIDRWA